MDIDMDRPISLLNSVYGEVTSPDFPLPMPADEAGLCADGIQRRYLWTDAFGVLAYTSIADRYKAASGKNGGDGNELYASKEIQYRKAANVLVDVVHNCLGSPRSSKAMDAMAKDPSSPTGHVGLRIGKVTTRQVTDYGMSYDGQYWHYIDKWLLALARSGHVEDGIRIAKSCFPAFFDAEGGGIRWKLSVDATAPSSLQWARANDDTLNALIVFSILESQRTSSMPSLADEIQLLTTALNGYRLTRVTDDPLGWGLEALYDQFLSGHPRRRALASLSSTALHPSHLQLPFRLYGAIIGARTAAAGKDYGELAPSSVVDALVERSMEHEDRAAAAAARGTNEEHSSINRVMLAMCMLCPGALGRRPSDPVISI